MWTIRFWQTWPRANRLLFLLIGTLFVAGLIAMWSGWFMQPSPAIQLQTIQEPELSEIAVDNFQRGPFDFTVRGNNYVILQRDLGSILQTNDEIAYAYLAAMAAFVVVMMAVITTLSRFYYLIGMGVFILFAATLNTELLGILGNYGKTFTVVVMALYGIASFYLFYFRMSASFLARLLTFTGITVFLGLVIHFLAVTEHPFLFLATHSVEAGLIATALFIVTVSHEIIAGLMFIVTQGGRNNKSLNHFFIITLIYLLNLVLAYCIRFGFIRWEIITIDLFLLLTISGILGIWGIRKRQKIFEGIVDAEPYGVFAFLIFGAFAFATIAFFMLNGNDPALSAISDLIIFSHLGFGIIFVIYIISNFGGMLAENYAVHKVLYSPNTMPFFTFRFGGLIATVAIAMYNTWQIPVNNAVAGYYNTVADLYLRLDNAEIATAYYDQARTYSFRGHHANYALANLAGSKFDLAGERNYFEDASGPRGTQMSFLNWAQTFQGQNENLRAIVALSEARRKLSQHDAVDNTLGLLYSRMGQPDSALKYLQLAQRSSRYETIASANLLALSALGTLPVPADTTGSQSDGPIHATNRLALLNFAGRVSNEALDFPTDTSINLSQAAYLSNYLINRRQTYDTTLIRKAIELAQRPSNSNYREAIVFAAAIAWYNSGETREAFEALEEVTVRSESKGKLNNILTMWSLENDEPVRAVDYADYALMQRNEAARTTYAVALTEQLMTPNRGNLGKAVAAWDSVLQSKDSITTALATRMKALLLLPPQQINLMSDEDKYAFARYRMRIADSLRLFELAASVQNEDLRGRMYLDYARKLYDQDYPQPANRALARIVGLSLTDPRIGKQMAILEILSSLQLGRESAVLEGVKQSPVDFTAKERKYQVLIDAIAARNARDTVRAAQLYRWLGSADPYFEDGVIAAARYFQNKGLTSYNILVEGLLYHPSSIRIRKEFAVESARIGFSDYSASALEELKPLIDPKEHAALASKVKQLLEERD